jgi:pimeloyl-ACP methyl ester carboxylesterase
MVMLHRDTRPSAFHCPTGCQKVRMQIVRDELTALPQALALNELPMPALILWGEKDTWIPKRVGERLHETLPRSVLVFYPDAGHVPNEEIGAHSVKDVVAFMEKAAFL